MRGELYYATQCRHFTGIHQDICKAGIRYDSVRDHQPGYRMARWPCLTLDKSPAATICEKRDYWTAEESRAMVASDDAAVAKFIADLDAGNCPHCGRPVEKQEQVGSCVYASPCGHRLGQGTAK